jgi:hypothetical protein
MAFPPRQISFDPRLVVSPYPDPPVPDIDDEGLMVPPWIKFPNLPLESMGWRMGMGEDYLHRAFGGWYNKQLRATHKRLWVKYPEPPGWTGFYRWLKRV